MQVKFIHFAEIDVSKKWIDVCVLINGEKSISHQQCFDQSKQLLATRTTLVSHLTSIKQARSETKVFEWSKVKKTKDYQAGKVAPTFWCLCKSRVGSTPVD